MSHAMHKKGQNNPQDPSRSSGIPRPAANSGSPQGCLETRAHLPHLVSSQIQRLVLVLACAFVYALGPLGFYIFHV